MDPEMERSPGIDSPRRSAGYVSRQLATAASGQRTPAVCNLEFTFPLETFLRLLTRLNQRNKTQPNCSAELPSCCCATPPVGSLQLWWCLDCAVVHLSEVKLKNPETILSSGTWRSNILFLSPVCSSGCRLQSTQSALHYPALGPWVSALTWEHMSTVQRPIIVANMWWRWNSENKPFTLMMNDKWQMPSLQTVCVYDWVVCCFKKYRNMIVNLNWRKSDLHKTWTLTVKVVNCSMMLGLFILKHRRIHELYTICETKKVI